MVRWDKLMRSWDPNTGGKGELFSFIYFYYRHEIMDARTAINFLFFYLNIQ